MGPRPRVREKRSRSASEVKRSGSTPARAGKTSEANALLMREAVHSRACGKNVGGHFLLPFWRVHSRACGKNDENQDSYVTATGPLPRVREKLAVGLILLRELRSTPARAGKTPASDQKSRECSVHSRACGKNGSMRDRRILVFGPLPRVREKREKVGDHAPKSRSTPARAGKT